MAQTTIEMARKKFKNAQDERNCKLKQERKKINPEKNCDDASLQPPREKKKELSVKEADQLIQLREELKNRFNRIGVDEVTAK